MIRKVPWYPIDIRQVRLLWDVLFLMYKLAPTLTFNSQGNDSICTKTSFDPCKVSSEIPSGKKISQNSHNNETIMFAMGSFSPNDQLCRCSSANLRRIYIFCAKNGASIPGNWPLESRISQESCRIIRVDHSSMFAMGSFSCYVQLGPHLYNWTNSGSSDHLPTPVMTLQESRCSNSYDPIVIARAIVSVDGENL